LKLESPWTYVREQVLCVGKRDAESGEFRTPARIGTYGEYRLARGGKRQLTTTMVSRKSPCKPVEDGKRTRETPRSVRSVQSHGKQPEKVVRVKPNEPRTPFNMYSKYAALEKAERPPDPYLTPYEKDMKEQIKSRERWLGKAFVVTDHKAAVARREIEQLADSFGSEKRGYVVPKRHTYRDVDPSKFVGERDFL